MTTPKYNLNVKQADYDQQIELLLGSKRESSEDVRRKVSDIIDTVRRRGDEALFELNRMFDRSDRREKGLRLTADEREAALEQVTEEQKSALEFAADRIRTYHEKHLPSDQFDVDDMGVGLGWRWTAVDATGVYVPGGTAAYPSTMLMNVIPAQVAKVKRIAMVTPLTDDQVNPLVVAAAELLGIDEIYAVGGAQAVAALAYGTKTIAPVDCIVGPGNAYVAAAKREVYGQVGIDQIAGPSEILVVADNSNNPEWIAADLLSQAEHDPSSQSLLITDNAQFGVEVIQAVAQQLETLPRKKIAGRSWQDFGGVIVVDDLVGQGAALANRVAAEHCLISGRADVQQALFDNIRHAGAIFLGPHTPETLSDYVAGPNHVLPTSRSARFSSGLGVMNFMKRTSVLSVSRQGLEYLGAPAITLAQAEGLDAHARAVQIREPGK